MNNGSHPGLYQSANNSASTLRPRAPRLISYLDDDTVESTAISTSAASSAQTPPRYPSRGVSPILNTNASKAPNISRNGRTPDSQSGASSRGQPLTGTGQGIWEPWTSIQGLASSFLWSDSTASSRDKPTSSFKTPLWMKQDKAYSASTKPVPQWGPNHEPGTSTQDLIEERKSKLESKKREALLLAAATDAQNSSGKYKRRDSDDHRSLRIPTDPSENVLVYMHKVHKEDTLAGVIIKYSCQGDAFRKVNRFWPNDNIQTRTHVLIPIEACSVRGRKVDSPYLSQDLFDPAPHSTSSLSLDATVPSSSQAVQEQNKKLPSISSTITAEPLSMFTSLSEEVEVKHDSWVMLPNFKEAVEVLRVPRRALAYFPRARRKSNSTISGISPNSTPKTSFDTLRHPPTHAAQLSASLNASPIRRPALQARLNSGRQRSASTTGSSNSFADSLRGPGGVGTLSGLRTEVARPGPGEDPLNKKFAQYLPDLHAPEDMPRTGFSFRPTPRATPRASIDSVRSTRSNSSGLVDVGGAIEGWVRKIGPRGLRERNAVAPKMGDLIELETNTEGVELATHSKSNLHREIARTYADESDDVPTPTTASPANGVDTSITSATEQALLNERFPMRGRVRNAYDKT